MKMLQLLPIGNFDGAAAAGVWRPRWPKIFACPMRDSRPAAGSGICLSSASGNSTTRPRSCRACKRYVDTGTWRVLGVTGVDLYIPILTFVFGEAQMGGPVLPWFPSTGCGRSSTGLPPDPEPAARTAGERSRA